jgi:hypothetical protein
MTANALRALIARVEAATGPDRELDDDAGRAFGWRRLDREAWFRPGERMATHDPTTLPRFTASLDAAVSLVPAGHRWAIQVLENFKPRAWCSKGYTNRPNAVGVTPALALTAAALHAKLAMMETANADT